MSLYREIFNHSISFDELQKAIRDDLNRVGVSGVTESVGSFLLSQIQDLSRRSTIFVVSSESTGQRMAEEIRGVSDCEVLFLPKKELMLSHIYTQSKEIIFERVGVLNQVSDLQEPVILVVGIEALIYRLMDPEVFRSNQIPLEVGRERAFDSLKDHLIQMGYERVDMAQTPGHFSVRGGILDVFDPGNPRPLRIEFFGDEVDSIRYFDENTQKSLEKLSATVLRPAIEGVFKEEEIQYLIETLREQRHIDFAKEIEGGLYREHLDQLLPYIEKRIYTILDYLPDARLVFMDYDRVMDRYRQILGDFDMRFQELYSQGEVLKSQWEMVLREEGFLKGIDRRKIINLTTLSAIDQTLGFDEIINFKVGSPNEYFGKTDRLFEDLKKYRHRGYRIILLVEDEEKIEFLKRTASDQGVVLDHVLGIKDQLVASQIALIRGALEKGFVLLPTKTMVITEKEIFGIRKKRRTRRFGDNAQVIRSFRELNEGDYVVHEGHGIGRYLGIDQVAVEGLIKDFLKIQYKNEEYLYIPIGQLQLIQKYVGSDAEKVQVNRLGTPEWSKTKARAKKAIDDMAEELIALYSERMALRGHAFAGEGPWQQEFESLFPFEETPDQLKSAEEIKRDMERVVPMDRLLCGDVGYGKTEVALRAVFKAVVDSKQVAILVPTTLLAQQHYNTIFERFSKYPIKVEMLSRFKTKKENDQTVEKLKKGLVDIVVGTHRLLSEDVKFKDLGLLVVDEEQRFGVRHKEKIKTLKSTVDVLTLTATPIPRTLHMSMIGIRDLSVIEDPPEDRYPIQTYVMAYRENIIREAVLREIDRNGQVFFVYNQVKDIDTMTGHLSDLVPEARVAYAHGQMNEMLLSKVMIGFLNKEFDVLVTTTIIETGLDIPNVNTIIIHNADKMGLSQLYQLRGRVGRSNRVAYAYLTYHRGKVISEVAQKRLLAIKEFTELGSGFKIALRDLEIRGAGNLLGGQQHGHLEAIGYELYVKLLEERINTLKGNPPRERFETAMEIKADSYIPETYIEDINQKLEIYKKISVIESREDYDEVMEELVDRFGDIPETVQDLLAIAYIRGRASLIPLSHIAGDPKGYRLYMVPERLLSPEVVVALSRSYPREIKINAGKKPHIFLSVPPSVTELRDRLKRLEELIEKIHGLVES